MDGDQDRADKEAGAQPPGATIETPDGNAHQKVSERQPTISEKVLVDRINRSDFWMIVLTAAIAFSGIVSAIIFGWQLIAMDGQLAEMRVTREGGYKSMTDQLTVMRDQAKAMQGQLDEMAIAQRPWIVITDQKIGGIGGSAKYGYYATETLDVINSGHSPAFNVQIVDRLVGIESHSVITEIRPAQTAACNEGVKPEIAKMTGPTIFPNETATVSSDGASISEDDVTKYTFRRGESYAHLPLVLVGCVIYQAADGVKLHHTPFSFMIEGRIDPTSSVPLSPGDFTLERTWRYGVTD